MATWCSSISEEATREQRAEALTRRVCEGWDKLMPDDFREIFAEDCVYQNMPIPGVNRGPEAIAAGVKGA